MYAKNGYAQSSFQRYRAVKIQTASPAQILIMLYDGAIRFALIAKKKIEEKDYAAKGTYIGKVQAIVAELMSSLDFSIAPELCTQLEQLYIYMMEQLSIANLKLETEPLDVTVQLLRTLRDGWHEALNSLPSDPTAGRETTARAPKQVHRPGAVPGASAPNVVSTRRPETPQLPSSGGSRQVALSSRRSTPITRTGLTGRPASGLVSRPMGGLSTRKPPPGSRRG